MFLNRLLKRPEIPGRTEEKKIRYLEADKDAQRRALLDYYIKIGCSPEAVALTATKAEKEGWDIMRLAEKCAPLVYCCDYKGLEERYAVYESPTERVKRHEILTPVYGAVLGDCIGSRYEGSRLSESEACFAAEEKESKFLCPTDDTVLTAATLEVIRSGKTPEITEEPLKYEDINDTCSYPVTGNPYAEAYKEKAGKFPHAGYGPNFERWMRGSSLKPYGSLGNGSAMRISPAGALFEKPGDVIRNAYYSAVATHNHVEGVKGAVITAMCIWMAKRGYSKDRIFEYMKKHYSYGESIFDRFTLGECREQYAYQVACPFSVPAAVTAFRESEDFESAIALVLQTGYDTDTNACICGSIAAAYYGLRREQKDFAASILERFVQNGPDV